MNFKKRSAKKVRWKFDETLNSRRAFKFDYWMGSSWFYGYSHLRVVWQQCFEDFCSTRESAIRVRESRPNIRVSINSRWTHRARRYINGNMNRYTSTYVACCILLLVIVHRSCAIPIRGERVGIELTVIPLNVEYDGWIKINCTRSLGVIAASPLKYNPSWRPAYTAKIDSWSLESINLMRPETINLMKPRNNKPHETSNQ